MAVLALLDGLGIEADSFDAFVAWALAEQLVSELARLVDAQPDHQTNALWNRKDGLRRFRNLLRDFTGRRWSSEDEQRLYERVQMASTAHDRKPISAADLLRVLWNKPHVCVLCGKSPPEVKLHIDHVFPASRGGSSEYGNLRFLCAPCNLRKSNRLEEGVPWLTSV